MSKTALICGISGQDGSYLSALLLSKGYRVVGTSRDVERSSFDGLKRLGISSHIEFNSMSLNDFRSVLHVIDQVKPDEVYNFAGQSSVGLSFDEPVETLYSHAIGTLNLLEAVRFLGNSARIYNAGSGECFGNMRGKLATELDPFYPRSPYAVAKAAAFWESVNYREAYGMYVCSGILFNHESPLRPSRFVTKKIVASACRIANGSPEKLVLGDLSVKRDWGWAPEYVVAMWQMLQLDKPDDFVIATGKSSSLQEFVSEVFSCVNRDWTHHVEVDPKLFRPSEIHESAGDSSKAKKILGWHANYGLKDLARLMVESEMSATIGGF